MPLPTDEKIVALSNQILQKFEALFGAHPGFRPAHAKGIMLNGTFTPTPEAASLSRAPHLNRPSSPATVRFSNSTGIPVIPDNDPNADPRGCAVRFYLADRVHTDIVAHSTNSFPARTGQDFLEFLTAITETDLTHIPGSPLEKYLGTHPAALAFVQEQVLFLLGHRGVSVEVLELPESRVPSQRLPQPTLVRYFAQSVSACDHSAKMVGP